jgi:5-methylcytosine-specific restriction endonuclease McrA
VASVKICTCPVCGKTWENQRSQKGDKYCSRRCYQKATGIQDCICERCHKRFHPNQQTKANRYCSHACHSLAVRMAPEKLRHHRLTYNQKYRREHPGWTHAVKAKRRAIENGAPGHFSATDWVSIKHRQRYRCAICGKRKKLTVDHIIALSNGGSNFPENIQGLCGPCNSQKWTN